MFIWTSMHIFKHEPNKKGKEKGRPHSFLRQVYRTEIREDGKGSDDKGSKGTPKLTGKSLTGNSRRLPCTNFKQGSCQNGNSCSYQHVPE